MKTEVARFVEEMLRWIRREFFAGHTEKQFFQERPMLIHAITWPAEWMNRRGAKLPASGYKRILGTVIQTIKRHGEQVRFRRFSLYFFKAVQEHMNHHGDEYYQAAKCRSIGAMLPAVTRDVGHRRAEDPTTAIMSQMNAVLRSPGGRRRRRDSIGQPELLPASNFSKVEAPIHSLGKKDICSR
jgi:hypothetical protein